MTRSSGRPPPAPAPGCVLNSLETARYVRPSNRCDLVWMGAFLFVFQNLAGLGVHPNFLCHRAALDVERIAKAGPTFFFLQLLIADLAGMGLQSDGPGLGHAHLSLLRQFLARVGDGRNCRHNQSQRAVQSLHNTPPADDTLWVRPACWPPSKRRLPSPILSIPKSAFSVNAVVVHCSKKPGSGQANRVSLSVGIKC